MKKSTRNGIIISSLVATASAAVAVAYKLKKNKEISESYHNMLDSINVSLSEIKEKITNSKLKLKLENSSFKFAGYSKVNEILFIYDRHNNLLGYKVDSEVPTQYFVPFEKGSTESLAQHYKKSNLLMIFEDSNVDNPIIPSGLAVYDGNTGDFLHYIKYNSEEDTFE